MGFRHSNGGELILRNAQNVFVTGATGFVGFQTVLALLEIGLKVTVLVRPDQHEKLAMLNDRIQIVQGDVWNKASLKGLARGCGTVIHLVGSARANPVQGATFHQINVVSTRNVATMAIGDGVSRFIFLSTINRPFSLSTEYILSKRDAEDYLQKSGLEWTIIRAPALYKGHPSQIGLNTISSFGAIFPLSLLWGRSVPLPVNVAARGIAQLVVDEESYRNRIIYAGLLRRLSRQALRQARRSGRPVKQVRQAQSQILDDNDSDEPPFGWLPPQT